MNPCRCGHLDDPALACGRAPRCAQEYQARISGPLFDCIDLHVDVPAVSPADLSLPPPAEGSAEVAARVAHCRGIQLARYERLPEDDRIRTNAEDDGTLLEEIAAPDSEGQKLLTEAVGRLKLSAPRLSPGAAGGAHAGRSSPHYSRLAADLSEVSGIGRVDGGFRGGFSLRVGD